MSVEKSPKKVNLQSECHRGGSVFTYQCVYLCNFSARLTLHSICVQSEEQTCSVVVNSVHTYGDGDKSRVPIIWIMHLCTRVLGLGLATARARKVHCPNRRSLVINLSLLVCPVLEQVPCNVQWMWRGVIDGCSLHIHIEDINPKIALKGNICSMDCCLNFSIGTQRVLRTGGST